MTRNFFGVEDVGEVAAREGTLITEFDVVATEARTVAAEPAGRMPFPLAILLLGLP